MAAGLLEKVGEKLGEKLGDFGLEWVIGKKDSQSMLETLRTNSESLSALALDINNQIKLEEQGGNRKRKHGIRNWLENEQKIQSEVSALLNEGSFRRLLGGGTRVSKLNTRVLELVRQGEYFVQHPLVAPEYRGERLVTSPFIGEAFQKNIDDILKWSVIDKVKSIGIYGMGGIGKTSLAQHVNNRLRNEDRCVYWITVSPAFTINKLQSDMAKVIGLDLSDEENEDKRAGRLNQALSQKEFVLILDDVCSDINLVKMGNPLGVGGCSLIVTTRSISVCQRIGCREIIKLETLQTDESWTLFRKTLGETMLITSDVEKTAKLVAKECGGLPLGIIVLAKTMKGVTDVRAWRKVYDEIRESPMELDDMEEKVFRVLKYSFDRLNPKLQLCFLYCSLYPEDYVIDKDKLVRRFISEELVDTKKSLEKQLDQGYNMLSELVGLCLLESTGFSGKGVKMHDFVRDMALSIARESPKYKVFAGLGLKEIPNEEEWTEDVDKISLMSNKIEEIQIGMAPDCPKLATLLLNENPLGSIPESFFSKMRDLRTLDLSYTAIRELPNSLSDLDNLNALLLNYCEDLVSLPYLGKLKALKELDLSCTSIKEMPKGMGNLINLKILLFTDTYNSNLLPGDLPLKSQNLQHLELPLQIEVPVYEIVWGKQLRKFVGWFKDVTDFNWFQSQTGGLISNFSYLVGNNEFHHQTPVDYCKNYLRLDECSLRREGEDGVVTILPEKIEELEINECKGLSSCVLDDFGYGIEELTIECCEGIESIWNINDQLMAETTIKVKSVTLWGLPDLKGLVNWEVGRGPEAAKLFSSLQRLDISICNKMKTLGLPLPRLHNIERIGVHYCQEIEEVIELVEEAEEISEPTISLPNLERLTLFYLPKLKSICKARIDCKSIKNIWIKKCPRVKKLPLFLPSSSDGHVINYSPPPALKEIRIEEEMWESLEWDDIRQKHPLQPFVKFW